MMNESAKEVINSGGKLFALNGTLNRCRYSVKNHSGATAIEKVAPLLNSTAVPITASLQPSVRVKVWVRFSVGIRAIRYEFL